MANWRKTRYPGIYVAHSKSCPAYDNASARCRCKPSWRGRAWDSGRHRAVWSRASKHRGEAVAWLAAMSKGADHLAELAKVGSTFESLGEQWLDGVERGHIGRRRGRGKVYSDTTIAGMLRSWKYRLRPEFGGQIAEEITEIDWRRWIDELARQGLSRSTIAKHVSVASGIYAWASAPSRRLVPRNPLRLVELPPSDEKPRLRVALAPEAAALLAAREPEGRLPYAIAFYAGLRRSELYRLEWPDVLDGDFIATRLLVRRSKSEAGTQRRPPIADNLRHVLAEAWERQGRPRDGKVVDRSVMSGKIARRVEKAWEAAGLNRITLHECRHTYASLLMAAGYTIKELMEYMGHADLQMVTRYVRLLAQPGESDAADRLNAYLRRAARDPTSGRRDPCDSSGRERTAELSAVATRRDLERHRSDQPPPRDDTVGAGRSGDRGKPSGADDRGGQPRDG